MKNSGLLKLKTTTIFKYSTAKQDFSGKQRLIIAFCIENK